MTGIGYKLSFNHFFDWDEFDQIRFGLYRKAQNGSKEIKNRSKMVEFNPKVKIYCLFQYI